MLNSQFPIPSCFRLHNEALFLPVLQHLADTVARNAGTLHADAMLESSLHTELHIQTLVDRVVLAHALGVVTTALVTALECCLYAVAEEIERRFYQVVGNDIVDIQQLRCLCL